MTRKIELQYSDFEKTKRFVDRNWKTALGIAGAAGAIGAAIWLTARYLREKKKREADHDKALQMIEEEVAMSEKDIAVTLETGTYLGDVAGDEGKSAMEELAGQMDDAQGKEAMEVLRRVIEIDRKK